jgi:hypothetical protein
MERLFEKEVWLSQYDCGTHVELATYWYIEGCKG